MAYFSNGTEAQIYETAYCEGMDCIYHDREQQGPYCCPILLVHWWCASNQDAKFADDGSPEREILDGLIPRDKDGANMKCNMLLSKPEGIDIDWKVQTRVSDIVVLQEPKEPTPVPCDKGDCRR